MSDTKVSPFVVNVADFISGPKHANRSRSGQEAQVANKFRISRASAKVYVSMARKHLGIARKYTKKAVEPSQEVLETATEA